ncbi:hypothetical protein DSO57_1000181 [Entomophthora muscae]|uniref:Uncharacterized protein n=1 Tax=Entomophthora muscae TaxID=34485 RepID=A0ACC2T9F0_9FUNG|nr:hypothetical protein DSO57_1000181 [Entomophthora muscae]
MSALLNFERAKFGVLCVETAASRKEVPTSLLEEAWASLEVTKNVPEESLVEVKVVFEELYSDYFSKEGTPSQGNQIYVWDSWNLLLGCDKILQQVKAKANCEIEALRARKEKSIENKSRGQDNGRMDWLDLDPSQFIWLARREILMAMVRGAGGFQFNFRGPT